MLGKIFKQIREDRGISQTELYDGLISKRQAIRFEQDEADIKGIVLLGLMERVGITSAELAGRTIGANPKGSKPWQEFNDLKKLSAADQTAALRSFYSKYRFSANKQTKRLAVLAGLMFDAENFEERDVEFLTDELVTATTLTFEQIHAFLQNIQRFPDLEKEDILNQVWDSIKDYQKSAFYPELVNEFVTAALQFYLFEKPNLASAKKWLNKLSGLSDLLSKSAKLDFISWEMLVKLADNSDANEVHAELSKRAQLLLLLGLDSAADELINQRRLVELNFTTHTWSDGEIGVIARKINRMGKDAKVSASDYLASFSGLLEAVRAKGQPFSSYLNSYDY